MSQNKIEEEFFKDGTPIHGEQIQRWIAMMDKQQQEVQRQRDEGLIEQAICEECGEENDRDFMEFSADNNKLICGGCDYNFEPYYNCSECNKLYCCEITKRCLVETEEDGIEGAYCENCIIETNRFDECDCDTCKEIENEQIFPK